MKLVSACSSHLHSGSMPRQQPLGIGHHCFIDFRHIYYELSLLTSVTSTMSCLIKRCMYQNHKVNHTHFVPNNACTHYAALILRTESINSFVVVLILCEIKDAFDFYCFHLAIQILKSWIFGCLIVGSYLSVFHMLLIILSIVLLPTYHVIQISMLFYVNY